MIETNPNRNVRGLIMRMHSRDKAFASEHDFIAVDCFIATSLDDAFEMFNQSDRSNLSEPKQHYSRTCRQVLLAIGLLKWQHV